MVIGRLKSLFCFKNTGMFIRSKRFAFAITSRLTRKKKGGKNYGLAKLYSEMESCRGYRDIQVMWEMLQSSSSPSVPKTNFNFNNTNNITISTKRRSSNLSWSRRFRFKPA